MDSSAPLMVEDGQRNLPTSPASVEGGKASHALPMNEPEPTTGGAIDTLEQIALTLQRATQPIAVTT